MKTKAFLDEPLNGIPMIKIYEVEESGAKASEFDRKTGEKKVKKHIFYMGLKKARVLLDNTAALEAFVRTEGGK